MASPLTSSKAREVVDRLREIGLGARLSLPQIAVCGDTSTGKSSLLSAISGVQFPSDTGLKTRCPTQVRMTEGTPLAVSVHVNFVEPLPSNDDGDVDDLTKKTSLLNLSEVANKIEDLTSRLRMLRDGADVFADTIVIEVTSPSVPNLTLIDLPGLVRTTTKSENNKMIGQVLRLVEGYLKEKRTVILAVVQANVDIHNAGILTDASAADPSGERTLGVLTMPDRVELASSLAVANVLDNRTKELALGWHMVRLRGQDQLNTGVSIKEFLSEEQHYFEEKNSPWSMCSPDSKGIVKLRERLARLLDDRIRDSLPSVLTEVIERRNRLTKELQALGEPLDTTSARRSLFTRSLNRVTHLLEDALDGVYNMDVEFFSDITHRIRATVRRSEEDFRDGFRIRINYEGCEFYEGDEVEYIDRVGSVRNDEWKQGKIAAKVENGYHIIDSDGAIIKPIMSDSAQVFTRSQLRYSRLPLLEKLRNARGRELPSFINFGLFNSLVADIIRSWREPTVKLFDAVYNTLASTTTAAVEHCVPSSLAPLRALFLGKLLRVFDTKRKELLAALDEELGEHGELRAHTLNHYYTDELIKLRNEPLETRLSSLLNSSSDPSADDKVSLKAVLAIIHAFGVGKVSNEEYEVIEIEFRLAAYIKVAQKRFIDNTQALLERRLLGPIRSNLARIFDFIDDARLAEILYEDSHVGVNRSRTTADLKMFQQAEIILQDFLSGAPRKRLDVSVVDKKVIKYRF